MSPMSRIEGPGAKEKAASMRVNDSGSKKIIRRWTDDANLRLSVGHRRARLLWALVKAPERMSTLSSQQKSSNEVGGTKEQELSVVT